MFIWRKHNNIHVQQHDLDKSECLRVDEGFCRIGCYIAILIFPLFRLAVSEQKGKMRKTFEHENKFYKF